MMNNYKQVFYGYSCDHTLSLEIDMNMGLLDSILNSLDKVISAKNSSLDGMIDNLDGISDSANVKINFTLKDKESIKNTAIENAIAVAKEKADIIAKSSSVELGEIIDINYSFGTINIYSDTNYERGFSADKEMVYGAKMSSIDMTPQDIDITDNVTITWSIR